ncbi:MAG: hypothetical protein KDD94_06700 [Calditrichaeota bacterium]|nr:hypothetical protein [Calditrichota bacterium]
MKDNDSELKSLIMVPAIIMTIVLIANILIFLFWIVEDVSDTEDEGLRKEAEYLTHLFIKDSILHVDRVLLAKQYTTDFTQIIEPKKLVLTIWSGDSLLFSSIDRNELSDFDVIFNYRNEIVWYYFDSGFINRSTYVIPYSFRKHSTITWISIVLFIGAVWGSRIWINRNRKLNRIHVLNDQWTRVGRITTGLLHEIRNPLNAISVNTQLIEEDLATSNLDSEEKNEMISSIWSIQREVQHLDTLLEEFNDYSKPQNLRFTRINLNLILQNAIDFFSGECEQKSIRIKTRLKPDLPRIKGDPNYIKQVFYNLITNAIQAMPDGGTLKISTFHRFDTIFINFTDSGIGVKEDRDNSIFDEFYSTKEKGTGLGLAIVRRVIENHNGKVVWRNNRKKGTTFTIQFRRRGFVIT